MNAPPHERPSRTHIGPTGRAAVEVLARCPRLPADVLSVLLGHRRAASTAQLLARLRRAGLAHPQAVRLGPLLGARPVRLWTLTAAGLDVLASRGLAAPSQQACRPPYGEADRRRTRARPRDVPLLVASYRLLAEIARTLDGPVRVCTWEHPWVRTIAAASGGYRRRVRLPAAAVLHSPRAHHQRPHSLLLLPDIGTTPLSSYRPTLQALLDLRRTMRIDNDDEPLLMVGVATSPRSSGARAEAWQALLKQVARRADERPLRARVLTLALPADGSLDDQPRPAEQVDEAFALLARHPLLTSQQLACLLGTSTRRAGQLVTALVEHGWLRPVACNAFRGARQALTREQVQRLGLVELTEAGRQEAARRLLIPPRLARRRHGMLVSDVARRRFLRQLDHTLGANAFFVDLAAAARRLSRRGGDEALVEWRSAAACARGRFRPDGYGCYRRGSARFGFFLEYDRGTERSGQYAAKLATYYRYRNSGASRRDYQGFPSLLVVTTSDLAEGRFAHQAYLAQERWGGVPLRVFLTTTARLLGHPDGALGPIWRGAGAVSQPDAAARVCWLPGRPGRSPADRVASTE